MYIWFIYFTISVHRIYIKNAQCKQNRERVVSTWNCLDDQCVSASSLNSFKSNLTRLRRRPMGLFIDNDVRDAPAARPAS